MLEIGLSEWYRTHREDLMSKSITPYLAVVQRQQKMFQSLEFDLLYGNVADQYRARVFLELTETVEHGEKQENTGKDSA